VLLVQAEFVVVVVCQQWPVPSFRNGRYLPVESSEMPLEEVVVFYLEVPSPGQEGLFIGIRLRQLRTNSFPKRRRVPGAFPPI